jgi:hypothetical protein
MNDILATPFSA